MKKLTSEEIARTNDIIANTKWVRDMINYQLTQEHKDWNNVMYQVAEAFGIVTIEKKEESK